MQRGGHADGVIARGAVGAQDGGCRCASRVGRECWQRTELLPLTAMRVEVEITLFYTHGKLLPLVHVPDADFVAVTVPLAELDGDILGDGIADLVWVTDAVSVGDGEKVLDQALALHVSGSAASRCSAAAVPTA